jgi:hypothetical protein
MGHVGGVGGSMLLQRQYPTTDCQHFNNCHMYQTVTRQRWRETIIVLTPGLLWLMTTKLQQITLVILFFYYGNIKYQGEVICTTTHTNKRRKKNLLMFVNVIEKV